MTSLVESVNLSPVKSLGKLFKESFGFALRLIRQQAGPLFILFIISCALNLTIQDAMRDGPKLPQGQTIALYVALGIWSLIEGAWLILILSWAVPVVRPPTAAAVLKDPFSEPYVNNFIGEYFRMLAQILLYALLLLIPGFIRHMRLIFVPYVALFSKSYRADEVDALKLSEKLMSGKMARLFAVIIGFLVIGIPGSALLSINEDSLILSLIQFTSTFFISIWGYALIFQMFETAMEELTENP